jgi:hypothetical protein
MVVTYASAANVPVTEFSALRGDDAAIEHGDTEFARSVDRATSG